MSEHSNKVIPKLRFPEFQGNAEWNISSLEQVFTSISNGLSLNQVHEKTSYMVTRIETISDNIIDLNKVGFIEPDCDISSFKLEIGDILFSNINSLSHIGRTVIVDKDYNLYHGMNLLRLSVRKDKNVCQFVYYLINTEDIKNSFKSRANKAVNQASINQTELGKTVVYLPLKNEQQKIADCLSSLDDLITAQNQKVEALKQHKKGLMQQLFPAEGETVPKLRFPEFENDGEWDLVELNKLGQLISGLTYSPEDIREAGLLVLRSSNVQDGQISLDDNVYVKSSIKGANLSKPNDILICVRNGSKALIGKNALIPDGIPLCTHGAFMTVFRSSTPRFVFQLFQTNAYQKQVEGDLGATINSINGSKFLKYEFYVPKDPEEQQKIANCLSSIDELISTQTQQLEAHKAHKKGLMQKLFPALEDSNT